MIPRRFIGENIIHLPTVKTHVFTTTTGAMKNAFGGLLNERRHWTHPVIHETLVDLLMIQKKIHRGVFAVMDGTFAGDGPGPRCMVPHVKNVILASADQVAIDAVAAKLMGLDPMCIKFIRLAHDLGLGCGDPRDIEIVGDTAAAAENWHFTGPFRKMTFASRMQHQIYWGPLKKPIEWSLKTVLAPWAYIASVVYHDSFWYPMLARHKMESVLASPWGRLFRHWDRVQSDGRGYPDDPGRRGADRAHGPQGTDPLARHPGDLHQGSAGDRQPAETQGENMMRLRRLAKTQRPLSLRAHLRNKRCPTSTSDPIRWTSSRSCGRFARAFERSAARTTRKPNFSSWQRSNSRRFSIRVVCDPISSISSGGTARSAPSRRSTEFEDTTLYETHRGPLRAIRRLLRPILKLFINPNSLTHALHLQSRMNDDFHKRLRQREEMEPLFYEVIHNLVVEITRLGIEVQNLKMRVESLSSRLDFDERRARSLESVVQYRRPAGPAGPSPSQPAAAQPAAAPASGQAGPPAIAGPPGASGQGADRHRRRRRRRRRPGRTMADRVAGSPESAGAPHTPGAGSSGGDAAGFADRDDDGNGSDGPDGDMGPEGSGATGSVKLAVVVQRYGADISGGAELHARYIAERLARHAAGRSADDLRARLRHVEERAAARRRQGQRPDRSPLSGHPPARHRLNSAADPRPSSRSRIRIADELNWLAARGPPARTSSATSGASATEFDFFVFFSYRYYHAWHGAARVAVDKAVLVPTAERDRRDRRLDFRAAVPGGARADVQLVRGARADPGRERPEGTGRRRRRRIGDSRADATVAVPEKIQREAAVRDLRRPHRREQGMRRAVRVLRALRRDVSARPRSRAGRVARAGDPETSAHPPSRVSSGRRQVRRGWPPPTSSSCRRGSRACRWWRSKRGRSASPCSPTAAATSCAARSSGATAGCTTRTSRNSPKRSMRSKAPGRSARCSDATAASSSGGITPGRSSSANTSRCSTG